MSYGEIPSGRRDRERQHRRELERARMRRARGRRRLFAGGGVLVLLAVIVAVALGAGGGGSGRGSGGGPGGGSGAAGSRGGTGRGSGSRSGAGSGARTGSGGGARLGPGGSTVTGKGTGVPGTVSAPILMYHVINPPPAGAHFPGLYVSAGEFAAQMQALKDAGWHAVTMDQLMAFWTRGVPLGPGKPIVLSFDNGYASQYTNALPVLAKLGWVGVENIQLAGLPPSQGGLSDDQVRGLLRAGWELDTQGISHADLIALGPAELTAQVAGARKTLQDRYHVPVNWFCYPSGHYNATVIAEVRRAGYVGSTTVVPGWANRVEDPFRLPRLRVLGGTSPSALLAQIATYEHSSPPPGAYGGAAGTAGG